MHIRRLLDDEYEDVVKLITQTVHTVCANDYTEKELAAWAPENFDIDKFRSNLFDCLNLAAFHGEMLVGFMSMEKSGYINRLYTHKDFLRRGVATSLLKEAEAWAKLHKVRQLSLDSSRTAEKFYLKMGFKKTGLSVINHGGVVFRNTVMKKVIRNGKA